ncbi:hypothetical protein CRE_15373 [Caenorhabditis remanei]|uniref:Uncharacterized protein n=1 Tax=Caenorhabditis remanei TaxID=31234 RepID=E3MBY5_CAERE|nr:hypothetical protein CRE_15373 [Caenorhabditis remanei]
MFASFWKFLVLLMIVLIGITLAAPIPNTDNADDFRYPENPDDINDVPMATVRPSVNPCN